MATIQQVQSGFVRFIDNQVAGAFEGWQKAVVIGGATPLTPANAEKFNIMCKAMKNVGFMSMEFTEEDAKEWVAKMDPPARWTMEQTTAVMNQRGYHHKPCKFWAVMNMMASDYGKTAAKHAVDKPEFWADMADAFIDDKDAEEDKVGRYWRDIVEK